MWKLFQVLFGLPYNFATVDLFFDASSSPRSSMFRDTCSETIIISGYPLYQAKAKGTSSTQSE